MKISSRIYFLLPLLLFSLRGYSQSCPLAVSISQSEPTICSGSSVTLTANAVNGTGFTYRWSTGEITQSISVNKGGNYYVIVSDNTPGCPPVKQPITIASGNTPDEPTANGATVCINTSAMLTATAPGGSYQWYDATGTFVMNGANYTTPPITANTTYYVQTTIGGCTSNRTAVPVYLTAKPTVTGATICAGSMGTLFAAGGDSYAWYPTAAANGTPLSTTSSFTTPVLYTTTTYYVVVITNGCASAPTPVTATVTPAPQPPTAADRAICSGDTVNLHADAPSGTFNWYSTPTGGTPLISSPDYTTPVLTANTNYYVENVINDCVSSRKKVTVTIIQHPDPPAPQIVTACYQTTAVLNAGNNNTLTYQWYNTATGGLLIYTGETYTTPVLTSSTIYYVEVVNGDCESSRSPITVNVNPTLIAPSCSGAIICSGSMATLTATAQSGTYQWFDAATGGTPLSSQNTYTTPALTATTVYYVQNTAGGCTSPRAMVTVTVLSAPAPPMVSNTPVSVCYGNSAILSASSPANNYAWYDAQTGGNLLSSEMVYPTPDLTATTIYYVETLNASGCPSTRVPVTVTVNPIPPAPSVNPVTPICPNNSAVLTVNSPSGEYQWYATATGGNMIFSGASYPTPDLIATTKYYVQNVAEGCVSPRTQVTVTVTGGVDQQFLYPSGTVCLSASNPVPAIYNSAGGTFSASPAGLIFVNNTTGEINLAASSPGTYQISFAGNGDCPHTTVSSFTIDAGALNADFTYAGPYCQDDITMLPSYPNGGSGGIFTAAAGLVFANSTTGLIDVSISTPGTYIVTNTIAASGSCSAAMAMATVTIDPRVNISAGPAQTVAAGMQVQLKGSISGGATTGTWSGGTGTFSPNKSSLNAIYTPGAGETVVYLTLTSADPPGPCGPKSSIDTINFESAPPKPTVQGTIVCEGGDTKLTATAPGGYYQWYSTPTSQVALASGPTFAISGLITTTDYYVQTTINGLVSPRADVTVTVDPEPAEPAASAVQVCAGSPAVLTATGSTGPTETYEWYDAGGNLIFKGDTYTTPVLQVNTSYYVQLNQNNCTGPRKEVDVSVSTIPQVTSAGSNVICTGNALNYTIQSDGVIPRYSWSRAAVTGISNPAVNNQKTNTITETLINTTNNPVNVTYVITPFNGMCAGPPFNYIVTVNPQPMVTSPPSAIVCNANTDNYQILFNTAATGYTWGRAAVNGISNAPVSGQGSDIIKEVLFNTTNAPVTVPYIINYQANNCTGTPFIFNETVNPNAVVQSGPTGTICSGVPQNYAITANIPGAIFTWSRDVVNGISNPAEPGKTSSTIDETLINTGTAPVTVTYRIVPNAYGCDGTPFTYKVKVNPVPITPVAKNNSPVCIGNTIQLFTTPLANTTYVWTAPNNTIYTTANVSIPNAGAADAGVYTLVIISSAGCPSPVSSSTVEIDAPGIAVASTPQAIVCSTVPYIQLNGQIQGGPQTGIWSGGNNPNGFSSPASLITQYVPSAADIAAGSVTLTLTSTSLAGCNATSSSITVTFGQTAGVDAGPNQNVCSQTNAVQLAGKTLLPVNVMWSSPTNGKFSPSADITTPMYAPSAADIKNGSVVLTLNVVNGGACIMQSDTMSIKFIGPPVLTPGKVVPVLKGGTATLDPVVNENALTYLWAPDTDINNIHIKNPVITGVTDRFYTLTVTDSLGCIATDTTYVKILPNVTIPNTFTPNGDGFNDTWQIPGLYSYPKTTVNIFNRYGALLYTSTGYSNPWDGTYHGKPVPSGAYYYIIDLKNGTVFSGSLTLVR